MKIQSVHPFLGNIGQPIIISGPCSAETEEQLIETAIELSKTRKVNLFRAGIWKPRTRPGNFEGIGKEALLWLKKAKELTGLRTAIEVGTPEHVEHALKAEVDVLWIGARTTVNPFVVQEIADALKGVDIVVLVKNPVNPDIELWDGAIERIFNANVKGIGAIHRGFSKFGNSKYRNIPQWELPIELKRRHPEMTLICDPSHICGRRDTLFEVAQQALDLSYNGLMIESHLHPEKAWSDSEQQVTPENLVHLLDSLKIRKQGGTEKNQQIELLRQHINLLDKELIEVLNKRMCISDQIGTHKKENQLTILQAERWIEVLESTVKEGLDKKLSKEFIEKIYSIIHVESINRQNEIMNH